MDHLFVIMFWGRGDRHPSVYGYVSDETDAIMICNEKNNDSDYGYGIGEAHYYYEVAHKVTG